MASTVCVQAGEPNAEALSRLVTDPGQVENSCGRATLPMYNGDMARSLTIKLPDDSGQTLEELGRRQRRSAEDVAEDILQRALAVARWRQSREQLQSRAEAAGFRSEDDILDAIS